MFDNITNDTITDPEEENTWGLEHHIYWVCHLFIIPEVAAFGLCGKYTFEKLHTACLKLILKLP